MPETNTIWRDAQPSDLAGLAALNDACFHADGPELVDWADYAKMMSDADMAIACAVSPENTVAAVSWAKMAISPAMLGGKVHPAYRHQGLGVQAIGWGEAQARAKEGPGAAVVIRNEAYDEGAQALYTSQGYTTDFVEYWMSRDLAGPLAEMPSDIRLETWSDSNAVRFYDTFIDSFKDRGGSRENAVTWISWNKDDEDFRPDLCLLALIEEEPVAFITAGPLKPPQFDAPIGWISQTGVRPAWRGRGIIDGLIGEISRRFVKEGFTKIGLDVNLNNPRALRVYERNGFSPVGRRAKFSKTLA